MNMVKVKTAELEGAQLDWAVAKAAGIDTIKSTIFGLMLPDTLGWTPSTDWSQGGPIIEREQIVYRHHDNSQYEACVMTGTIGVNRKRTAVQVGSTLLIAAMRAFVASKLGDEMEVQV